MTEPLPQLSQVLGDLAVRTCPVCGAATARAKLFLKRSIDPARLTGLSFASRKLPEYMNHRLVTCPDCDTVFAAEAPSPAMLASVYRDAGYDSAEEAAQAARTYRRIITPALKRLTRRSTALEIGTGTGVFLQTLGDAGFATLVGIEPSRAAIDAAPAAIRPSILEGIFNPTDFAAGSLSLICCFQTLEHVPNPHALTQAAFNLLAPGGLLAFVTHNRSALLNRLLGRRSPIIDVEHLQLFNPDSITYLLHGAGFADVNVSSFRNTYALRYWLRLAPLPLKSQIINAANATGLGAQKISLNVGNILTTAFKPITPP